jgi:acyl-CoA synthetase (AMP-forming)/AMP-acid ligase II
MFGFYDENGQDRNRTETVGELYSRSPMVFEGTGKDPDKTAEAMKGDDLVQETWACGTKTAIFTLLIKGNMIISGAKLSPL